MNIKYPLLFLAPIVSWFGYKGARAMIPEVADKENNIKIKDQPDQDCYEECIGNGCKPKEFK